MFYEVMPIYLSMGMTYQEFWYGDPYLTVVYRKAWELRKEQINHEVWWQGFYIYEAFSVVAHNLVSKKGKQEEYPREPHRLTPLTEEERREKKKAVHDQLTNYFQAKKKAFEENNGRSEQQLKNQPVP